MAVNKDTKCLRMELCMIYDVVCLVKFSKMYIKDYFAGINLITLIIIFTGDLK
jgi:hypothetical protein